MALLYVDQFVGYGASGTVSATNWLPFFDRRWVAPTGGNTTLENTTITASTLPGRIFNTSFVEVRNRTAIFNVGQEAQYLCAGFLFNRATATNMRVASFVYGLQTTDTLEINTSGQMIVNGISSDPATFDPIGYTYITIECDCSAGEIRVYKDNDVTTPVLVAPTSLLSVSNFSIGHTVYNSPPHRFADMYILDDTGPAPFNAPLGIVQYKPLPLVAEDNADFLPQGGAASNLVAVNKDTRSFTTYNRSQVSNGLYDRFTTDPSAVESSDDVLGVVVHASALRDVGEPRTLALELNDAGGTVSEDFSDLAVGAWTDNRYALLTTEGDGTTPLTPASLSNMKVGYRVKA